MAFFATLVVSFSVFLALPIDTLEDSLPTVSSGVEESLRALKMEWESIFNSNYESLSLTGLQLSTTNNSCGKFFVGSPAGCQEIGLQGEGRALLVSAEDGRYYHEDLVSIYSTQFTRDLLHFVFNTV